MNVGTYQKKNKKIFTIHVPPISTVEGKFIYVTVWKRNYVETGKFISGHKLSQFSGRISLSFCWIITVCNQFIEWISSMSVFPFRSLINLWRLRGVIFQFSRFSCRWETFNCFCAWCYTWSDELLPHIWNVWCNCGSCQHLNWQRFWFLCEICELPFEAFKRWKRNYGESGIFISGLMP